MTASKQSNPAKHGTKNTEPRGDFLREDGESGYKSHGGPARLLNALR